MLTLTSPSFAWEGYENMPYICDAEENYPDGWIYNYNNNDAWVKIEYPYLYIGDGYFNVYGYDMSNTDNIYEYYAHIAVSGDNFYTYDSTTKEYTKFDSNPWIYMGFFFNEPKEEENPATPVETYDVTVNLEETYYYPDYNNNKYEETPLKSFDAQLEVWEDGTYTLKNIFGTDYSISYTLGNYSPLNVALLTFTGNISVEEGYEDMPDLLTPAGKAMHVTVEDENGEQITAKYLWGTEGKNYSYVEKTIDENGNVKQYDVCINVSGYVYGGDTIGMLDMYLTFSYGQKDSDPSSVADVEVNENAPVEYFNLQGVKVAEPSNGIFIRKQGSKTSKVAVK